MGEIRGDTVGIRWSICLIRCVEWVLLARSGVEQGWVVIGLGVRGCGAPWAGPCAELCVKSVCRSMCRFVSMYCMCAGLCVGSCARLQYVQKGYMARDELNQEVKEGRGGEGERGMISSLKS